MVEKLIEVNERCVQFHRTHGRFPDAVEIGVSNSEVRASFLRAAEIADRMGGGLGYDEARSIACKPDEEWHRRAENPAAIARLLIARAREVYDKDYIAKCELEEPGSLLGLCARLERAITAAGPEPRDWTKRDSEDAGIP